MSDRDAETWRALVKDLPERDLVEMQALIATLEHRFSTPEFRVRGDALEAELRTRGLSFAPIDWTPPQER